MRARRRTVAALALAAALPPLPVAGVSDAAPLPPLTDLRELARRIRQAGQPALLLFSTPGCAYCAEVRRGYLRPRLDAGGDMAWLIRELSIVGRQPLIDLDGRKIEASALAQRFGVRVVPVVHIVDDRLSPLVEPLVGLNAAFYESYLDERMTQGRARLRR
jgi:hypothetical protein